MSVPASYVPVPVEVARQIAKNFDKQVVVIIAEDGVHGQIHATTYGVDELDKIRAAELGPVLATAAGGFVPAAQSFEDFRDAAKAATQHDRDLAELRTALEESVRLQSHYAKLLNGIVFENADAWIARLRENRTLPRVERSAD